MAALFELPQSFMGQVVDNDPTEFTFSSNVRQRIEQCYFQEDPKYVAAVAKSGGQGGTIQFVAVGPVQDPDSGEWSSKPREIKLGLGKSFKLVDPVGEGDAIKKSQYVTSDEYDSFSGSSGFGRFIADLTKKLQKEPGVNDEDFVVTFGDKAVALGPAGYRWLVWNYLRGFEDLEGYRNSALFEGMTVDWKDEEVEPRGNEKPDKKFFRTVLAKIVELDGEEIRPELSEPVNYYSDAWDSWGEQTGGGGAKANVQPKPQAAKAVPAAKQTQTNGTAAKATPAAKPAAKAVAPAKPAAKATQVKAEAEPAAAAVTALSPEEAQTYAEEVLLPAAMDEKYAGDNGQGLFRQWALQQPEVKATQILKNYVVQKAVFASLQQGEAPPVVAG